MNLGTAPREKLSETRLIQVLPTYFPAHWPSCVSSPRLKSELRVELNQLMSFSSQTRPVPTHLWTRGSVDSLFSRGSLEESKSQGSSLGSVSKLSGKDRCRERTSHSVRSPGRVPWALCEKGCQPPCQQERGHLEGRLMFLGCGRV